MKFNEAQSNKHIFNNNIVYFLFAFLLFNQTSLALEEKKITSFNSNTTSFTDRSASVNKEIILKSAWASKKVYEVYEDFNNFPQHYTISKNKEGFYEPTGYFTTLIGDSPYKLESIFCAKNILKYQECGLFVTFYKPLNNENLPIIAVKGTTSVSDWKNNLFNRGTFFIKWFFKVLEANTIGDYHKGDLSEVFLFLRNFMGKEFIITGHSLGGGLAQTMAIAITNEFKENTLKINLVSFNSLAGESLISRLQKDLTNLLTIPTRVIFRPEKNSFDVTNTSYIPRNIYALNISTEDDVMQRVNRLLRKKNIGIKIILPSRRTVHSEASIPFPEDAAEGHRMLSVLDDLNFTYSPQALIQINRMLEINSSKESDLARKRNAVKYVNQWDLNRNKDLHPGYSPVELEAYYSVYRYPLKREAIYRRMKDFLTSNTIRKVMGIK